MKKIFSKYLIPVLGIALISFYSCSKDDDTSTSSTTSSTTNVTVEFDHRITQSDGSESALLFNTTYTLNNSDNITEYINFTKFQYFVSNFALVKSDGSVYTVTQADSYFFVAHKDKSTQKITLPNIPEGDYTSVKFTIGIDREKELALADASLRTGLFDQYVYPGSDMTWEWNAGHIFLKSEGNVATGNIKKISFARHIGLYGGQPGNETINNIKTVELALTTPAKVTTKITPNIHLKVEVSKLFPTGFSATQAATIMTGANSADIANSYANGMFIYGHTEN